MDDEHENRSPCRARSWRKALSAGSHHEMGQFFDLLCGIQTRSRLASWTERKEQSQSKTN